MSTSAHLMVEVTMTNNLSEIGDAGATFFAVFFSALLAALCPQPASVA